MTLLEDAGGWVAGLSHGDIPERVLDLARRQILSVMGAAYAGAGSGWAAPVVDAAEGWWGDGPCAAYPDGAGRPVFAAVLQNCALSMALDYDDYLYLAHTGHSSVFVPMAVAEAQAADTGTMLTAQVAANEVAGRLGASVVVGPLNGQMLGHVHLAGAAAGASRVLGLDADTTADAMAIALSEPVYPLVPAFMGSQSKVLIAAVPAVTGTMAALLAREGMTGPRGILEQRLGFLERFSFLPLPSVFDDFGRRWVTDTLAFKPYPGCAYVDTAVDALFEIMETFERERGRGIEPSEVREITVEAGQLTLSMEKLSSGFRERERLMPGHVNFSVALSLALALTAGELSGAQFTGEYLRANRERILDLASRVVLRHDASMTLELFKSFDEVLDLRATLASQLDLKDVLRARHALRGYLKEVSTLGPSELLSAWKSMSREDRGFVRGLLSPRAMLAGRGHAREERSFEDLSLPFSSRVTVALMDGKSITAEARNQRGAPGDPGRLDVPVEKFKRESSGFMGRRAAGDAVRTVLDLESRSLGELRAALSASKARR